MSFFKEFVKGYSLAQQKDNEKQDKIDAMKQEIVAKTDAEMILADHKAKREAEAAAEASKSRVSMLGLSDPTIAATSGTPSFDKIISTPVQGLASVATPGSTAETAPAPATTVEDPLEIMKKYSKIAQVGYATGDTALAKAAEIKVQDAKYALDYGDKQRSKAREDTITVEGLNPAKELIKEDNEQLSKNEINSSLHEKYTGEVRNVNYGNPSVADDAKIANEVRDYSKKAGKLTSILANVSKDPATDKSSFSAEELKSDAVSLVKYNNMLNNPKFKDTHDSIAANMTDIVSRYPEAKQAIMKTLGYKQIAKGTGTTIKESSNVSLTKPTITEEEYNNLPSGATYLGGDGNYHIKGKK